MRNLTIKRTKSYVACLAKMKVYIEDRVSGDLVINGVSCRKLGTLKNGEEATRIAISSSGWSKLVFNGNVYYAVSNFLTTDLNYVAAPEYEEVPQDDGVETRFVAVNEQVTAKIEVNLRTLPSVEHPDCKVVTLLKNGTVLTRTGINDELGWSRLDYNGQTVYCVSSMLKVVG